MRLCPIVLWTALISACVRPIAQAQQPSAPATGENQRAVDSNSALKEVFAAKIKAEWEAVKNKDKKAYGDLLDDDYQGVELDGEGERNKMQAIRELQSTNVASYDLFGLKVMPLGSDSVFIVYEVTMRFPPGSSLPYSRIYVGALWVKRGGQWKELHYQETHVK